jgi:predicted neutral ceramidase superfamily lipid hydrolase
MIGNRERTGTPPSAPHVVAEYGIAIVLDIFLTESSELNVDLTSFNSVETLSTCVCVTILAAVHFPRQFVVIVLLHAESSVTNPRLNICIVNKIVSIAYISLCITCSTPIVM